jgi:hypothetical protein
MLKRADSEMATAVKRLRTSEEGASVVTSVAAVGEGGSRADTDDDDAIVAAPMFKVARPPKANISALANSAARAAAAAATVATTTTTATATTTTA